MNETSPVQSEAEQHPGLEQYNPPPVCLPQPNGLPPVPVSGESEDEMDVLEPVDVVEGYQLGFHIGTVAESLLWSKISDNELYHLRKAHWFLLRTITRLAELPRNDPDVLEGYISEPPMTKRFFLFRKDHTLLRLDNLQARFCLQGVVFDALGMILQKRFAMCVDSRIEELRAAAGLILLAIRSLEAQLPKGDGG